MKTEAMIYHLTKRLNAHRVLAAAAQPVADWLLTVAMLDLWRRRAEAKSIAK